MRQQQKIWDEEHKKNPSIPSLGSPTPSDAVIAFTEYLEKIGITPPQKVVDIGCGKGRNTIYLAQQGFHVFGMDYIKAAIDQTKKLAKIHNVSRAIKLFTIAIDNYSSIDIETKKGRGIYKKELLRTLKPGGHALVAVVSANDELEQTMSPGLEPNSTIWPNGKFQKNYTEEELREFYKEFKIMELKKITKPAFKLGKKYMATNYWVILKT